MDRRIAALLYCIGVDENTSLQGCRRATRETASDIIKTLRKYASHETNLNDKIAPSLSFIYSMFSLLCILISEEFDAVLIAIVEDNPEPLTSLFPKGTPLENVLREADFIAGLTRMYYENATRHNGIKPVRSLTHYEMKLCLQDRGMIPRTLPAWKLSQKSGTLTRIVHSNLHVAIDPFTPPELAGKKVEAMLREFQVKQTKEIEESWGSELKAGIVDKNFPARTAKEERLRYDFRRAYSGNKKTRGETTFEIMLRRLEIYDLDRRRFPPPEIIKKLGEHYNNLTGVKISQDKAQARAYIDAALSGLPISAVPNVRAGR